MEKWWKCNKNRIAMVLMALTVCFASLAPSFQVNAQGSVFNDVNGDGKMTLDEVNIKNLVAYGLSACGYWIQETFLEKLYNSEIFTNWCIGASDKILGYLTDKGAVTLSEDMWQSIHTFANVIRGDDGYTVYPGFPNDPMYYVNLVSGVSSSNITKFVNGYADFVKVGDMVTLTSTGPRIFRVESSVYQNEGFTTYPEHIYIFSGDHTKIMVYHFDESGSLVRSARFKNAYYYAPQNGGSGSVSVTNPLNYLKLENDLAGFVGGGQVVFNDVTSVYNYFGYSRNIWAFDGDYTYVTIPNSILNGRDWVVFNGQAYETLMKQITDARLEDGFNDLTLQQLVNEYSQSIIDELGKIEDGQEEQTGLLQKIHDLLAKWLPFLEKKEDIDKEFNDSISDFNDNSNVQSGQLGDLNNQTGTDKVDIDSTSQDIDSNLDVETDANYGVLLSTFTENNNILTMLLVSVSIALISFVFFGKR